MKYFGYFHADGFWEKAPGLLPQIIEMKNSNVVVIGHHHSAEDMKLVLDMCRKNRFKAWVMAYDCFFEWNPKRTGNVKMFEDWKIRWQKLKDKVKGNEDVILGFYFDEPYWNGVGEEDFRLATQTIRKEYPKKRVMACLTVCELDPAKWKPELPEVSSTYYEYCTDGAYDFYSKWDAYYAWLHEKLKTKLVKNQSIWMIPWLFTRDTPDTSPEVLAENLRNMYKMAEAEPRCVGLIAFSFASGDKGDWGHGGNRLFDPKHKLYSQKLRDLYLNMGRCIVEGKKLDIKAN